LTGGEPAVGIRAERPEDVAGIRAVNLAAFETPFEADLVDRLRAVAEPFLSLVATRADRVVGHILFTPVTLAPESDSAEVAVEACTTRSRCRRKP
jgi:putative acetyltransferase